MVINSQVGGLQAKLAVVGVPDCGKRQILQDWSTRQGQGEIFHELVSEVSVFRAPFLWKELPRPGWTMLLEAFTTDGEIPYSAVQEMLLDDVDGIVFVAPVDSSRAVMIRESLVGLGQVLARHRQHLGEIPLVMHYHQAEKMPDFDPKSLDDFLGVPQGSVPTVVTRSDDGSPLTASLAILLQKLMNQAESSISVEEQAS